MIKRELFSQIKKWLGEEKILIIKGARQTGKTTLMFFIKDFLEKKGEKTVYFSVDRELNNPIFKDGNLFISFIRDQYLTISKRKKTYIFIDEFQYIENAGIFLKTIFDQEKSRIQIIVSGSSSLEITKNSEFLTGRKIDFYLDRFSFREFLKVRSKFRYDFSWNLEDDFKKLETFYKNYERDLSANFLEYLAWGGYPEVTTTPDSEKREIILREIVSTYIQKDVSGFLGVENISGFNNLVALLCGQVGNLVNKNELSNTVGIDTRSLSKYLDILEGTFVFSFLTPFFSNKRKNLSKRSKVYLEDLGIAKVFLNKKSYIDFAEIGGNIIENFVYNELQHKKTFSELFFFRTLSGAEVDFIAGDSNDLWAFEVKFRNKVKKVPLSLRNFKSSKKIVFSKNELKKSSDGVLFIPVILLPFLKM